MLNDISYPSYSILPISHHGLVIHWEPFRQLHSEDCYNRGAVHTTCTEHTTVVYIHTCVGFVHRGGGLG